MKSILVIILLINTYFISLAQSIESISFSAVSSSNNDFQPIAGNSFSGYVSNSSGSLTIASEYGRNDFKSSSSIVPSPNIENNVKIYPNPTDNYIIIDEFSRNRKDFNSVSINDINGKRVFFIENYIDKTPIDFKSFQNGVYLIVLSINNEVITTRKIIKSK